MVYRVRNKGFDIFAAAMNPRAGDGKKTKIALEMGKCVTLQVQQTRYTGMRIKHGYRNISRATKTFLMGDRVLEQLTILTLKHHFFRPMHYASPIENQFYLVSKKQNKCKVIQHTNIIELLYRVVLSLISLIDTKLYSPTINIQFN